MNIMEPCTGYTREGLEVKIEHSESYTYPWVYKHPVMGDHIYITSSGMYFINPSNYERVSETRNFDIVSIIEPSFNGVHTSCVGYTRDNEEVLITYNPDDEMFPWQYIDDRDQYHTITREGKNGCNVDSSFDIIRTRSATLDDYKKYLNPRKRKS